MDDQDRQESESIPPDLYAVRMTVTRESFAKLMQDFKLDAGCRPHPEVNPDGTATLLVYATQEQFRELQAGGYPAELGENVSETGRERQKEVGVGDRFQGGRVA